ncbi:three-helix bundle dimerization domain-containing protein [Mycobacterium sp. DL99]|uniref:three-helix bundle dimerization domain-containing protein n=1 Tax=Mycobacterium sp. DL99 TaxID=2528957 RepID=UPI001AEC4338|nr:hypothetical protein [Mycobacterium sp. DL99]
MIEVSEQAALTEMERRLTSEFPEVTAATIHAAIMLAYGRFATSRIRDFVPLFVERQARKQVSRLYLAGQLVAPGVERDVVVIGADVNPPSSPGD